MGDRSVIFRTVWINLNFVIIKPFRLKQDLPVSILKPTQFSQPFNWKDLFSDLLDQELQRYFRQILTRNTNSYGLVSHPYDSTQHSQDIFHMPLVPFEETESAAARWHN